MTRSRALAAALAAAVALSLALAACGGLKTRRRADLPKPERPTESFLVQVVDAPPPIPVIGVSVSVLDQSVNAPLPDEAPEDVVEAMRQAAAAHGAEWLVVERVDTEWRKAFYGFGVRRWYEGDPPPAIPDCAHPDALRAREKATREAARCLEALAKERPGLTGRVEVVFQVDAFGDVYRLAATPESSRDTQVQACALAAVASRSWGDHAALVCRMALEVSM